MLQRYTYCLLLLCLGFWAQAQLTTASLSLARHSPGGASTNGLVMYAGGVGASSSPEPFETTRKRVDLYELATDTWTIDSVMVARQFTFVEAIGNKFYVAGYTTSVGDPDYDLVEVYDTDTGLWSTLTMPTLEEATSMTATDGKLFLVDGGSVDIYDAATGTWDSGTLSQSRILAKAMGCNGKVLFAGGGSLAQGLFDIVDVYDIATDTWSTTNLSEAKNQMQAACAGTKIYYAGGALNFTDYSQKIEVYDTETGSWETLPISAEKYSFGFAASDSRLYIAGGVDQDENIITDELEIVDPATGDATFDMLAQARGLITGVVASDGRLFFGGGSGSFGTRYNTVDIYTEMTVSTDDPTHAETYRVFPNPTSGRLYISRADREATGEAYRLFDALGKLVSAGMYDGGIDVANLPQGIYTLTLSGEDPRLYRVVKQ